MLRNGCLVADSTSARMRSFDCSRSETSDDAEFVTATESFTLSHNLSYCLSIVSFGGTRLLFLDLYTGNIDYGTARKTTTPPASFRHSPKTGTPILPSSHLAQVVGGEVGDDSPIFSIRSRTTSGVPNALPLQSTAHRSRQSFTQNSSPPNDKFENIPRYSSRGSPVSLPLDTVPEPKAAASGISCHDTTARRRKKRSSCNKIVSIDKDRPVTRKRSLKYSACPKRDPFGSILKAIASYGFDNSTIQSLPPALRHYFFKRKSLPCPQLHYAVLPLATPVTSGHSTKPTRQRNLSDEIYDTYRLAVFSSKCQALPKFSKLFPNDIHLLSKRERHDMALKVALEVLLRRTVAAKVQYRIQHAYRC